ncbi:MAG TPA: DUF3810 domain-containing protein [Flavobacterium sp.]|nr:DUF3810 domain-containing protein [Flavobacterium sp.]
MEFFKKHKLISFLILQILLIRLLAFFPETVEKYYTQGFYSFLSTTSRTFFAKFSFSVGDILYGLVILFLSYYILKNRKTISLKSTFIGLLNFISVFYFLFNLCWGLNNYRIPLKDKMDLSYAYSFEELLDFTDTMIHKANTLQLQLTQNVNLVVESPYSNQQIYEMTLDAYDLLAQSDRSFSYTHPCVKNSLISLPLSYMGFGGYLNPFTSEAQVNARLPKYSFPATALHEIAHQVGYASESEANFIGYLASEASNDLYFKYAGVTSALRYCLRNIEKIDPALLEMYAAKINSGVLQNFEQSKEFWQAHQNPFEQVFSVFYDNFLKLNNQSDGLDAYSKYVGLLISYQKK